MIKEWLDSYKPANEQEAKDALREIMHEITLAGLYRSGFFEKAAFYGGTALRIFHGLDRYSEDLDFSLLQINHDFTLSKYEDAIIREFESLGMKVSFKAKVKQPGNPIESTFLKSDTLWQELVLQDIIPQHGINRTANIKVKIEVDTVPPLGFQTEDRLLLRPFSSYIKCFSIPDLFAGKMHALMFRKWGKNVKGRDWYDLEWYIRNNYALNIRHFAIRAYESGDWQKKEITEQELMEILKARIDSVDFKFAKNDIVRFIKDSGKLEIWSNSYFHELIKQLKFIGG